MRAHTVLLVAGGSTYSCGPSFSLRSLEASTASKCVRRQMLQLFAGGLTCACGVLSSPVFNFFFWLPSPGFRYNPSPFHEPAFIAVPPGRFQFHVRYVSRPSSSGHPAPTPPLGGGGPVRASTHIHFRSTYALKKKSIPC